MKEYDLSKSILDNAREKEKDDLEQNSIPYIDKFYNLYNKLNSSILNLGEHISIHSDILTHLDKVNPQLNIEFDKNDHSSLNSSRPPKKDNIMKSFLIRI